MTEHGVVPGLWPIQGDGVLARQGDLVLLIHPAGGRFTDRLLELLADAARTRASGLEFTDRVSAEFDADAGTADAGTADAGTADAGTADTGTADTGTADTGNEQGPAAVAFGPAGAGTAVAVYGAGWAEITTSRGAQRLTPGEPYGRLRAVLPSALVQVRAGVQAVASDAETDPYLRLADGMVRAVALLYVPAETPAGPAGQARPAAPDYGLAPQVIPAAPVVVEPPTPVPVVEEPPPAPAMDQPAPVVAPVPEPAPVVVPEPALTPAWPAPEPALTPAWPAPEPEPTPEPEPDEGLQATPEPYADEPEYHATRVEPSVPSPAQPDPYTAVDPYPAQHPDPYAAQASDPYAGPDPYAVQAPPLPADPYAAQGPPDGAPGPDFISMPLAADQPGAMPQRDPLPLGAEPAEAKDLGLVEVPPAMVDGVYCKNGHFNDPDARNCAVCGIGMGHLMKQRQKGNRPPLGVLLLSDGSVCQLDADYVIGREPTLDGAVAEGRARPLRLANASGVVSRMHARVELDGWHVFITDLNSANGTQVLMPGERNPVNLQPGVRTPLAPGAQIRLGGEYGLQYDSHRQQ